jgi:hypothetical protein
LLLAFLFLLLWNSSSPFKKEEDWEINALFFSSRLPILRDIAKKKFFLPPPKEEEEDQEESEFWEE